MDQLASSPRRGPRSLARRLAVGILGDRFDAWQLRRYVRKGFPERYRHRVTVVVPFYNVEAYIERCLESIAAQTYINLEIILVDDGSPDGSRKIAEKFVAQDPRFILLTQENAGLGAARNVGFRRATGDFVAFVDSDDELAPHAYELMLASLMRSGSDFAVAGFEHIAGESRWRDDWVHRVHGEDQAGITVDDLPEVTKNVYAWNKLYRREFFAQHIGGYPEGVLNEDQVPAAKGYALSRRFDVLAATVYQWRLRDDGSSITQSRLKIKNLDDRISAERAVSTIYRDHASSEIQLYRWRDFVGPDFAQFYRQAHKGNEAYWKQTSTFLADLFAVLPAEVWTGVPVRERCLAYAISIGSRETAKTLVSIQSELPDGVPVVHDPKGDMVDVAAWGLDELGFPEAILRIEAIDTTLRTGFTRFARLRDGSIEIEGFCFLDNSRAMTAEAEIRAELMCTDGEVVQLEVERFKYASDDPQLPRTSYVTHEESGIRLRIRDLDAPEPPENAAIRITVRQENRESSGFFAAQDATHAPYLPPSWGITGTLLNLRVDDFAGINLALKRPLVVTESVRTGPGREIAIELEAPEGLSPGHELVFTLETQAHDVNKREGRVELPLPELEGGERVSLEFQLPRRTDGDDFYVDQKWKAELIGPSAVEPLIFPKLATVSSVTDPIRVDWDELSGQLILADPPWYAEAAVSAAEEGSVVVTGLLFGESASSPALVFLAPNGTIKRPEEWAIDTATGRFSATFSFASDDFQTDGSGVRLIYGLCVIGADNADPFTGARVAYRSPQSVNGFCRVVAMPGGELEISDFGFLRSVLLRVNESNQPH